MTHGELAARVVPLWQWLAYCRRQSLVRLEEEALSELAALEAELARRDRIARLFGGRS